MSVRLSPATVLAGASLFFALGGSALAVSHAIKPQARCSNGAVRAFANVAGDPNAGMANLPDQFSSDKILFRSTFNCAGGGVQVRRVQTGIYEIRFPGSTSQNALVSASNSDSWVQTLGPGFFRVGVHIQGGQNYSDSGFTVVAV